jgi:hypothetical protein
MVNLYRWTHVVICRVTNRHVRTLNTTVVITGCIVGAKVNDTRNRSYLMYECSFGGGIEFYCDEDDEYDE